MLLARRFPIRNRLARIPLRERRQHLTKGVSRCPMERDHIAVGLPRFLRIDSPSHLDAVALVHEPVEDAVGQRHLSVRACVRPAVARSGSASALE